jgi:prepilin-type N-terminal cleavage/methylation domain-containing protein
VKRTAQGFTVVEMLIVLALMSVLAAVGFTTYRDFKFNQSLTNAASQLAIDLQYARELASKYEDTVYVDLYDRYYSIYPRQAYTAYATKTVDCDLEFDHARISMNSYTVPQTLKVLQGGCFALSGTSTPAAFSIRITKPDFPRLRTVTIDLSGRVNDLEW